jgi:putative membrane protein insertion efficiency factor
MNPAQHILVAALRVYRATLSPLLAALTGPGGGCRFHPTCSAYALEAVQRHGAGRGSWLALKRVARCHPWGGCGHDPVPPAGPGPAGLSHSLSGPGTPAGKAATFGLR